MQRSILILALACVAALFLPACGESAAGGIEGTWVIDKSHFEGEVMKMLDAALTNVPGMDDLPAAAREMAESKMEEQRTAMKKSVAASDFSVVIKADGTWTSSGSMMGSTKDEAGTWKLDGDKFTVVTTGDAKEDDKHGVFSGDKIEMHMEDGPMKATLRLLRK